jgi:hypothetical protein
MPKIAITAIDMNVLNDPNEYNSYSNLPAKQKIDRLVHHIKTICEDLKHKEPDAMWIVSWREYGITEKIDNTTPIDARDNTVPVEIKKLLRSKCRN